jgi:hypothetical protein
MAILRLLLLEKPEQNVHEDSGDADDDELSSYTDKVKRRINQLTSRRNRLLKKLWQHTSMPNKFAPRTHR